MRSLVLAAVALVALSYDIEAMENKPNGELKMVAEISLEMIDYESSLHSEGYYVWRYGIGDTYEEYSEKHNIDIKTLRGENFQPREFWAQPFKEILHTLYPVIRKYQVLHIANFDTDDICFYPHEEPHYEFINEISHTFPEIIEYYVEEESFREINGWMEKRGLKPVGWNEYQESLHNHYGAKEPLKIHDPKARKLPLYEYFLPCFL